MGVREEVLDAVGTGEGSRWLGREGIPPQGARPGLRTKIKSRVVYFLLSHITITKMALFFVFDFASHLLPRHMVSYYL